MPISNYFNQTASIERLSAVIGSNKETWQTSVASVNVAIHPLSPDQTMLGGGAYTQFKMYLPSGTDIKKGDRVKIGLDTYTVQGVSLYDDVISGNTYIFAGVAKGE